MPYLVLLAIVFVVLHLPRWWSRQEIARYQAERPDLPWTGAQLARQLLIDEGLDETVDLEQTDGGDHYDPETRTVRLCREHLDGRSLSALAVAAHEVSHAVQHARNDPWMALRSELVRFSQQAERIGSAVMFMGPILLLLVRTPAIVVAVFAALIGTRLLSTLIHLATLPVELDASFRKALPTLESLGILNTADKARVRRILTAAAWTYVAGALASLVDVAQWVRMLRR